MAQSMGGGGGEQMSEDIETLRQILDNLVVFSFEQEDLMEDFKQIDYGSAAFGKKLNVQNDLKLNFQHIDDSIFALSLRQPMIGELINESLTEMCEMSKSRSMESSWFVPDNAGTTKSVVHLSSIVTCAFKEI